MLNLGLIGDIELLEPFIEKALGNAAINIAGKSSVGTQPRPGNYRIQAPEFNRLELIERSDILFINKLSLIPFSLLCDMVKKSKHFFVVNYPELKLSEISHLAKLASEAQTTVQIANPFYYKPPMQWFSKKIKSPAYFDVTYFHSEFEEKYILMQIMLMFKDVAGQLPKKTNVVSYYSNSANSTFNNIKLDYGNGTIINLNLGKKEDSKVFTLKGYMNEQFAELDLISDTCILNRTPINLTELDIINETSSFFNAVLRNKKADTDLEIYALVMQTVNHISEKLSRYASH